MNHGKESSKFNWDCTICPSCRWTVSDPIVLRWREARNRLAGIRVASGPVSAVRREFLTLAKVTWVVPCMTAHTYAGLLSDHKWTIGQWCYGKEDCCIDRWAGNGRGAHTIVHEVFRLFRFRRPDTPPDRGGVLTSSELLWRRRRAMRGASSRQCARDWYRPSPGAPTLGGGARPWSPPHGRG